MSAAAAALPMSWGDLADEAPMTRSASPPPAPRAAAAPGAPRKAPGKLPFKSPATKPAAKPATKPAAKPVPRGFAILAEVSDEEEAAPAPAPAPAAPVVVIPKPAPVVKMPSMMTEEELEAEENKGRTCLRIANLPMDITKRKLEEIFSEFTGFDQVALPLKFGRPRGFAFVDFRCPDDAADCLYAVRGSLEIKGKRVDGQTHIVVVEYARNNVAPTRA